ncbi:hypothetical protein ACOI1H_13375 [Loktanella sp. DJP18]|uniref:hypothetical protein n=1 Tax=Loktanella sp. DJP18 TaxID=3409788 RepID=UPI003BB77955
MQSTKNTSLGMSLILVDALGPDEARYLADDFFAPLAVQLRDARGDLPVEAHMPSLLAVTMMDIMEAYASRSHIGVETAMCFTTAFAFCATNARAMPAFAGERMAAIEILKRSCATPQGSFRYRGIRLEDDLFTVFSATLLCAARAIVTAPDGVSAAAPENTALADRQKSLRVVMSIHACLCGVGMLRGLSEKSLDKLQLLLDIVEPQLPKLEHLQLAMAE